MQKTPNLEVNFDFFSTERLGDIILLRLKENLMFRATDLSVRDRVLEYFDLVSEVDSVKVVVIISSSAKKECEEYFEFFHKVLKTNLDRGDIHRLHNVFSQLIFKIIDLNKIVVHASSGCVMPLFLNMSLACDYRIVAYKTVFQNPYLRLGLVPIGGGPFFFSKMLGRSKAFSILLSGNDITAHQAMRLGIVDEVVPSVRLEEAAIDTARRFAQKPARSLAGVKRLINYSMKDLKDYMEMEHKELLRVVAFREHPDQTPDIYGNFK